MVKSLAPQHGPAQACPANFMDSGAYVFWWDCPFNIETLNKKNKFSSHYIWLNRVGRVKNGDW
jgi:hypothetical protein